jgi:hypothetical protein
MAAINSLRRRWRYVPSIVTFERAEAAIDTKLDGRLTIIAVPYTTSVNRADKRMLGLAEKLPEVPV